MPRIEYFEPMTGILITYFLDLKDFYALVEKDFKGWEEKVKIININILIGKKHYIWNGY